MEVGTVVNDIFTSDIFEEIRHVIEYEFKAELYETALLSYNILVDLT